MEMILLEITGCLIYVDQLWKNSYQAFNTDNTVLSYHRDDMVYIHTYICTHTHIHIHIHSPNEIMDIYIRNFLSFFFALRHAHTHTHKQLEIFSLFLNHLQLLSWFIFIKFDVIIKWYVRVFLVQFPRRVIVSRHLVQVWMKHRHVGDILVYEKHYAYVWRNMEQIWCQTFKQSSHTLVPVWTKETDHVIMSRACTCARPDKN